MEYALWTITAMALILSAFSDKHKTIQALKFAWKKWVSTLGLFLIVLIIFAIVVTFLPAEILQKVIGAESGLSGILISLGIGSISVMPGFAAYPLGAALKMQDVPLFIIAGFVMALMNVGIVSFPFEQKFLGFRVTLMRNILGLFVSIIVVIAFKLLLNE
jgi:uncharacterized membrane protein YraQ (UPF0718 family)